MISIVRISPSVGERTIAMSVLLRPAHWIPPRPACATPAPMIPPTRAWLDDDGMPLSQVTTFQNIAPTSAPNTTAGVIRSLSIRPLPMVSATLCSCGQLKRQKVSREIEEGGKGDRADRADQPRADNRRDRIGGVVQAVEKVEGERDDDQADEERESELVHQRVIDNDAVDLVRHVLERIRHSLEILEHFASDRELQRIGPGSLERAPQAQSVDLVCLRPRGSTSRPGQLMQPGAVARRCSGAAAPPRPSPRRLPR